MQKPTSSKASRPNNRDYPPVRLTTLLRHEDTSPHTEHGNSTSNRRTQAPKHNPTLHAPTRTKQRRMDSRRNNRQRTSQTTLRSRLHLSTDSTRRNNAIQKTQVTPLFLYHSIILNNCSFRATRSIRKTKKRALNSVESF